MSGSLLAVETSSMWTGAAVIDQQGVRASIQAESLSKHNELLPGVISQVMDRAGRTFSDLSWIAVSIGPGSFTALRIGLLAVKGIAFARGLDIIPVMTLDVINASLSSESLSADCSPPSFNQGCLRLPIMDAYKGELFAAVYSGQKRLTDPAIIDPSKINQLTDNQPVMVFGTAFDKYQNQIRKSLGSHLIELEQPLIPPSPAALAVLAWDRTNQAQSPQDMEPFYLRRPDARLPGDKKNASR